MITFSIIIPARNEERNIARCLHSISAVEWPSNDFEVLLIDNGSSDRTVQIATDHGARVFIRPGDSVAGLRNFGASQSVGNILVFIDADCTVSPEWFSSASQYLDQVEVVCFGSPPIVPDDCIWVQRAWFHIRRKVGVAETEWLESMNMFVRKESFDLVSGFNAELVTCEDYDLSVRLRSLGRLISDDRILAVHHGEASSLKHFFRKEHWRALGNIRGMGSHSFDWRELPSVLLPLIYCFFVLTAVVCLFTALFFQRNFFFYSLGVLLLVWQFPIWCLAFWKVRRNGGFIEATQLYMLLNIYFFARGLASLRL